MQSALLLARTYRKRDNRHGNRYDAYAYAENFKRFVIFFYRLRVGVAGKYRHEHEQQHEHYVNTEHAVYGNLQPDGNDFVGENGIHGITRVYHGKHKTAYERKKVQPAGNDRAV